MKIEIYINDEAEDLEIAVTCKQLTADVEKVIAALRIINHQMTAKQNGEIHLLDTDQIIYIESVERKCFIYTTDNVYESDFKLYELEHQLEELHFFRASKSFLINLQKIQSLKADIIEKSALQ